MQPRLRRTSRQAGSFNIERDLIEAIEEGAVLRVRPKAMTVAVIVAGLFPILLGAGTGSEVMRRIAAPMVGGMITATHCHGKRCGVYRSRRPCSYSARSLRPSGDSGTVVYLGVIERPDDRAGTGRSGALPRQARKRVPSILKFENFRIEFCDALLGQGACTCPVLRGVEDQQFTDLFQGKPSRLGFTNEL